MIRTAVPTGTHDSPYTPQFSTPCGQATPESRAAVEARYGFITPELHIICPENGWWVEIYRLTESGEVANVRHEGNIEEARRLREKTTQQELAFWHGSYELRGWLLRCLRQHRAAE